MIRPVTILLLAAGLALAAAPGFAQTGDTPRHSRKATKAKPAPVNTAAPLSGGINAPSTDFSKIERADEEPRGPKGSTFRPTMGAGGMGLGAGF